MQNPTCALNNNALESNLPIMGLPAAVLAPEEIGIRVPQLKCLERAPGCFCMVTCPVGDIMTLHLLERNDFETAIRNLFHKGEPVEIPASMGATFINGLWDRPKLSAFIDTFPTEDEGMEAVMADKARFKTQMIILSNGPYSAVTAAEVSLEEDAWIKRSLAIRLYHELAHYVCRMLYPDNIDALRDEAVADMAGLVGAFNTYDTDKALLFFGVSAHDNASVPPIREGGRLWNYLKEDDDPTEAATRVRAMVYALEHIVRDQFPAFAADPQKSVLDMVASPEFQNALIQI